MLRCTQTCIWTSYMKAVCVVMPIWVINLTHWHTAVGCTYMSTRTIPGDTTCNFGIHWGMHSLYSAMKLYKQMTLCINTCIVLRPTLYVQSLLVHCTTSRGSRYIKIVYHKEDMLIEELPKPSPIPYTGALPTDCVWGDQDQKGHGACTRPWRMRQCLVHVFSTSRQQ